MYVERENNDNFVLYFILRRTIKSLEKKFLIDRLCLRYSSGQYIYIYKLRQSRAVLYKNNTRFNFVLIDNTYCFQLKFKIVYKKYVSFKKENICYSVKKNLSFS